MCAEIGSETLKRPALWVSYYSLYWENGYQRARAGVGVHLTPKGEHRCGLPKVLGAEKRRVCVSCSAIHGKS